ncbi:hypothetical protein BJD20_13195 [Acinetobacter proteolyticus]|nr:hypothetical protein BJD20_13195 [Acinetobacter proteolyticus]
MSNSEQQIEQEIQSKGLTAPRLTPDHIDSKIKTKEFHLLPNMITVCILVLENGFKITGLNHASVSPENFDEEFGQKLSFEDARQKIWELEGYLLKEKIYQDSFKPKNHIERMGLEKAELDNKLTGLNSFLSNLGADNSPLVDDNQAYLLEQQSKLMTQYSNVLGERILYDTKLWGVINS